MQLPIAAPATEPIAAPATEPASDRHLLEVIALCQKRIRAGIPWAARCCTLSHADGKVVHFIRHGQAVHNLLAAEPGAIKCGCKRRTPDGCDAPRDDCPYNATAAFDAPLTASGRAQADMLAGVAPAVQLVVSSPLRRTLQTALHAFPALEKQRVVAHEGVREQIGMHLCDRRRDTDAIEADLGERVSLAGLSPTDELWSTQRESKDEVADRLVGFVEWLMQRPEDEIAVTTHHHVLLVLFNCVLHGEADEEWLRQPFAVGEMRSVRLRAVVG